MNTHIVKSFDDVMAHLNDGVAQMGKLTKQQLQDVLQFLEKDDRALAREVINFDKNINAMEEKVEKRALRLIALRQPVARDLREAVSSFKIALNLERVGDHVKNIAKRMLAINKSDDAFNSSLNKVVEMGHISHARLIDVLDAYEERNVDKALATWQRDEEINTMYYNIYHTFLQDVSLGSADVYMPLIFVSKSFERIGDHATNIAEIIYFIDKGKRLVR